MELFINDYEIVKIVGAYFPGGRSNNTVRCEFKSDLRKLLNVEGNYFICGDLNSKHREWGCYRANTWGNIIYDLTHLFPFSVRFPQNPTHIPSSSSYRPFTIDLVLTNSSHLIDYPFVAIALNSDHFPSAFSRQQKFSLQFLQNKLVTVQFRIVEAFKTKSIIFYWNFRLNRY